MAKTLPNRAVDYNVLRRNNNNYQDRIRKEDVEALFASLTLRHGALRLDRLTRTCSIHGRSCPLTRLEYELLAFMLMHRGEVFSRYELVEQAWQRELSSINQVAVFIVGLRKKLGSGILRTVRGQGYTIDTKKSGRLSVVSRQLTKRKPRKDRL
jgi:DNA-binding response OmpR family regulator